MLPRLLLLTLSPVLFLVVQGGLEESSTEEVTVCTVYSGATPSPPPDTIHRIVSWGTGWLGGSWDINILQTEQLSKDAVCLGVGICQGAHFAFP